MSPQKKKPKPKSEDPSEDDRAAAHEFAETIMKEVPDVCKKSFAITKIEEALLRE